MNDHNQLTTYLDRWNLSNPRLIAQTVTSYVYSVMHDGVMVALKLLLPYGQDEHVGALALTYFDGHGAVRVLRHDDSAFLMEYAGGDELITLVERGEDEAATRIIADVLTQIHGASGRGNPPDGLYLLEYWFRALFKKAAADRQSGVASIYVRGAAVAERLLAAPRDVCVLHGDIHHRNIRHSPRGWLAFDPKGLVGERTYDCANTLCNPYPLTERVHDETRLLTHAAILANELEIEYQRVLSFVFAYGCLSASWGLAPDGSDPRGEVEWALKVARIVEPHLSIM